MTSPPGGLTQTHAQQPPRLALEDVQIELTADSLGFVAQQNATDRHRKLLKSTAKGPASHLLVQRWSTFKKDRFSKLSVALVIVSLVSLKQHGYVRMPGPS